MGLFRAAHGWWGVGVRGVGDKPKMMKFGTVIPYLNKI